MFSSSESHHSRRRRLCKWVFRIRKHRKNLNWLSGRLRARRGTAGRCRHRREGSLGEKTWSSGKHSSLVNSLAAAALLRVTHKMPHNTCTPLAGQVLIRKPWELRNKCCSYLGTVSTKKCLNTASQGLYALSLHGVWDWGTLPLWLTERAMYVFV
jgi:hypothetical protein